MAQTKVKLIADGVIVQSNLNASHGITTADIGENASYLYYTDARVSNYLSTNGYDTATNIIASITDSAPSTLDTLNELAAALGDDANFSTTVTNSIATKLPLAGGTLTGNLNAKNILFSTSALPAANNPGINLRDTNNEFYFQSGSAHVFNFIRYDNRNSMMNLESTGISVTGGGTFSGNISGVRGFFNSGSTNVVATFTSTDGTATLQCADPTGNVEFGASGNNFVVQPAGGVAQLTVGSSTSTFAGEIRTSNRLAIKETNFGYSSSYKVIQVGESAAEKSISLGYDPSGNTSGSFSGNEILIPNNIRILAPAANNSGYYGLMMLNSSNKVLLGASNYLMESNYIMALDTATKNVGIGTDSPTSKLHLRDPGTNSDVGIKIGNDSRDWNLKVMGSVSDSLQFFTHDNSNVITILPSGNVGIGTTSPGRGLTIDKSNEFASLEIIKNNTGNQIAYLGTGSSGASDLGILQLKDNNTIAIQLYAGGDSWLNGGNVGIGTTSPTFKTHIRGGSGTEETVLKIDKSSAADSGGHTTIIGLGCESAGWAKAGIAFERTGAYDTGKMHFLMYPTGLNTGSVGLGNSAMTINNDGNVGIGTADPDHKLEVVGGLALRNSNSRLYFGTNNGTDRRALEGNTSGSLLQVGEGYTDIALQGNVGINTTSPAAKLDVAGDITIQNGLYTYKTQGYTAGSSAINVDITVGNEGGAGNVFKIEAGFAHYYGMSYNSIGEWWCTSRGTTVINTYILNAGTTFGGTWSSSKPNNTTLRVTKSAGTYAGGGKWWIKVTYVPF